MTTRREFLRMGGMGALGAVAGMARFGDPAHGAAARRPNFIIFLADDMGYGDVGAFGSALNRTPNVDRMAGEGMKLNSFYACPVCTPSRAQFMTGCYAKRVGLPNVIFPSCPIGLNPEEKTLPRLLKEQNYDTFCIGKWHLGDQREFLPTRHGFDHYFGIPYSNDMGGPEKWVAGVPEAGGRARRPPLPLVRDTEVAETLTPRGQDAITERYTTEAVRFIREQHRNPFFLYFAHNAVHVPLHPGDEWRGKSKNGTYGDWVEEVDWSIGRVLDAVREAGLADNTFVIFTSDNGPWLTQRQNGGIAGPLRGGKGSTWEGGVREPTVAWWPGRIAAGTTSEAITSNMDLLPTFVGLAGGRVPTSPKIDGVDIWPVLNGSAKESTVEAHWYFNGSRLEAVRSGPWKLGLRPQKEALPGEKPFTQAEIAAHKPRLYNLAQEVGERTDVAADHPDVVAHLQELAAKMNADLGADGSGTGVRPPGRVENPSPLLMKGG